MKLENNNELNKDIYLDLFVSKTKFAYIKNNINE